MQPMGRRCPRSARAQRPVGTRRNVGLCGRDHDRPQLMRKPLGRSLTPTIQFPIDGVDLNSTEGRTTSYVWRGEHFEALITGD